MSKSNFFTLGDLNDLFESRNEAFPRQLSRARCRNERVCYDPYKQRLYTGKIGRYAGYVYYVSHTAGVPYRIYLDLKLDDLHEMIDNQLLLF